MGVRLNEIATWRDAPLKPVQIGGAAVGQPIFMTEVQVIPIYIKGRRLLALLDSEAISSFMRAGLVSKFNIALDKLEETAQI